MLVLVTPARIWKKNFDSRNSSSGFDPSSPVSSSVPPELFAICRSADRVHLSFGAKADGVDAVVACVDLADDAGRCVLQSVGEDDDGFVIEARGRHALCFLDARADTRPAAGIGIVAIHRAAAGYAARVVVLPPANRGHCQTRERCLARPVGIVIEADDRNAVVGLDEIHEVACGLLQAPPCGSRPGAGGVRHAAGLVERQHDADGGRSDRVGLQREDKILVGFVAVDRHATCRGDVLAAPPVKANQMRASANRFGP